jgi:pimeloyl-ACP methyl ester carboxylesterase
MLHLSMNLTYRLALLLVIALIGNTTFAQQSLMSTWESKLGTVPIILKIKTDSITHQQSAVYDSPSQGAFGLKVSDLQITKDSLSAFSKVIGAGFKGKFSEDKTEIIGKWAQSGRELATTFKKVNNKIEAKRPQTPTAPFPYDIQNVIYYNKDKTIKYGATLTLPKSDHPVPAVILISGSGQEDRDETIFDHKPFWVLADHLSRNGIAVLRVDDRGVGESTGDVKNATSLDFASDVLQSLDFLKSQAHIDIKHIGLIGHSEGGMIAPMVAAQSKDVSFIVSLAGVGIKGSKILKSQWDYGFANMGLSADELKQTSSLIDLIIKLVFEYKNDDQLADDFEKQFEDWRKKQSDSFLIKLKMKGPGSDEQISKMASPYFMPWMRYFIMYDPATTLGQLKIPLLALNGGKDVQVNATDNLAGFKRYLTQAGNKNFKTIVLPNLNHLFQTAKTGGISEYGTIEETLIQKL